MSQELINHNEDLKRLKDEGYQIEIKDGYLLVHNVPYVDKNKKVRLGVLVSALTLSGDKTATPNDHVCLFIGEEPCNADGSIIEGLQNSELNIPLADGSIIQRSFSRRPPEGYPDYHKKMVAYCDILEHQSHEINPNISAKNHFQNSSDTSNDSVFCYHDTNSSRAMIGNTNKLSDMKIAIIGLGGTGSYLLDFLAKTNVKEIHLFDDDELETHNAFRMPGAISKEDLDQGIKKVVYLKQIYSKMRTGIIEHECKVTKENNLDQLQGINLNFVFICMDSSPDQEFIFEYLLNNKIPFIDMGIGVEKRDGSSLLTATARTTFVTDATTWADRISFAKRDPGDYGNPNIQIAEVNALNATLAIIRWKKWAQIYENRSEEDNSLYDLSRNELTF